LSANILEHIKGVGGGGALQLDASSNYFRMIDSMPRSDGTEQSTGIIQSINFGVHNYSRADAPNIPIFSQQLEYIYTTVYEQEYAELPMANGEVLPIDTEVPNTAETYSYMTLTASGLAKMGNVYAMRDIPRVSLSGTKEVGNVVAILNCYGFSIQDMRIAAAVPQGGRLEAALPKAARRAHEEIQNTVGWWGDTKHKLKGLITHPNVPVDYAPNGTLGSPLWTSKDFLEIFTDIVMTIEGVAERTYGRETVTHVYLPRKYRKVLKLKMITNTNITLEKHIRDEYGDIQFHYVNELDATHPKNLIGKNIMIALNQDRDAASLVMPQIFEQFDPQWYGLEWLTVCHSRFGGVKMPRPYSVGMLIGF
jgi:hypothetical protein